MSKVVFSKLFLYLASITLVLFGFSLRHVLYIQKSLVCRLSDFLVMMVARGKNKS